MMPGWYIATEETDIIARCHWEASRYVEAFFFCSQRDVLRETPGSTAARTSWRLSTRAARYIDIDGRQLHLNDQALRKPYPDHASRGRRVANGLREVLTGIGGVQAVIAKADASVRLHRDFVIARSFVACGPERKPFTHSGSLGAASRRSTDKAARCSGHSTTKVVMTARTTGTA